MIESILKGNFLIKDGWRKDLRDEAVAMTGSSHSNMLDQFEPEIRDHRDDAWARTGEKFAPGVVTDKINIMSL